MRLKLIFSSIVAIATCAVFAIASHNSQQKLTDAELANIEALSNGEQHKYSFSCYNEVEHTGNSSDMDMECSSCSFKPFHKGIKGLSECGSF